MAFRQLANHLRPDHSSQLTDATRHAIIPVFDLFNGLKADAGRLHGSDLHGSVFGSQGTSQSPLRRNGI